MSNTKIIPDFCGLITISLSRDSFHETGPIFFGSVLKHSQLPHMRPYNSFSYSEAALMEKDEAKLAFFDLKNENQNTDVGYERYQLFSGLKPQIA